MSNIVKCSLGVAIVVGLAAASFGSNTCYFLMRKGCGSGQTFCTNGSTVCEFSYTASTDTGCGFRGPVDVPLARKCWTLTNAVTHPCDATPPATLVQIGCAENGACCFGDLVDNGLPPPGGNFNTPSGEQCCEIKAER